LNRYPAREHVGVAAGQQTNSACAPQCAHIQASQSLLGVQVAQVTEGALVRLL